MPEVKSKKHHYQPLVLASNYDREPRLRDDEYAAIDSLLNRPNKIGGWKKQVHQALRRLLIPLYDVYDIDGRNVNARHRTVSRFLTEMHQREKAFWGWSREEWLETICTNSGDFLERHRDKAVTRHYMVAVSYLLCEFTDVQCYGHLHPTYLAPRIFGHKAVDNAVQTVYKTLLEWGFTPYFRNQWANALSLVLIVNQSSRLEDITFERLASLRESSMPEYLKGHLHNLSRVLVSLGILEKLLPPQESAADKARIEKHSALKNVPAEWAKWCQRWRDSSTHAPKTRQSTFYDLLVAGRWAAQEFPEIHTPADWTREIAAAYVAAVCRMKVGEYSSRPVAKQIGKPLTPGAKSHLLSGLRMFFRNCQEWEWIPRRFDPIRCLRAPLSVRAQIGPDPRVIADDVWAKLLYAGLNLTAEDIPRLGRAQSPAKTGNSWYPIEMLKAVVIVWLFAGLRSDEICRLRLGCIHWQSELSSITRDEP